MIKVTNKEDIEKVIKSVSVKDTYTSSEIQAIKQTLEFNVEILTETYGDTGSGGYIAIMDLDGKSLEVYKEIENELSKFSLRQDDYEYDDVISHSAETEVHFRLYIMTEYHLMLIYKKGRDCDEVFL